MKLVHRVRPWWCSAFLLAFFASGNCAQAIQLSLQLTSLTIEQKMQGQIVQFVVSGDVLLNEESDTVTAQLSVLVDMADLQKKIAPIVQALGNRNDGCGDQLQLHTITLMPAEPLAEIDIDGHYEKWVCDKIFGKNKLFEQNPSAKIHLTPQIEGSQTITLGFEVADLNVDGLLGSLLKDGTIGPPLKKGLLDALRPIFGPPLRVSLPEPFKGYDPVFDRVWFVALSGGKLGMRLEGRFNLSVSQIKNLMGGA